MSQMLALAFHNWISAAAGIVAAVALVRGFARRQSSGIGNFWADLTRCTIYLLLPICLVGTLFMDRPDALGCSRSVTGNGVNKVGRAVLKWNQRAVGRVVQLIIQIDRNVIRRG